MQTLLAIDTTSDFCCVGLSHNSTLYSSTSNTKNSHADTLLSLVEKTVNDAGITLKNIDAIALTVGPGSFTGIRIGLSMVQGLAYGLSIPVLAINKLELLAHVCVATNLNKIDEPEEPFHHVLVATDASMGDVFWQAFKVTQNDDVRRLESLTWPSATKIDKAQKVFDQTYGSAHIIGDAFTKQKIMMPHKAETCFTLNTLCEQLVALAIQKHDQGEAIDAFSVEPLYVRTQITWKKRERIRETNK